MSSYGYIEVVGLVPAVVAADVALKTSKVEVVGKQNTGAGMIAVIICGEIGAVRSAIEAAEDAVSPIGTVVNVMVIAKPEEAISVMYE